MKRFEYTIIHHQNGKDFENVLNALGKDGWEMVGCGTRHSGHVIYFKREII